jgi:hypothetical protein
MTASIHRSPALAQSEERSTLSAARSTAAIFGILAGLGGLVHGVGEVLQGNVKPEGLVIDSWTQGPIASNMGGEPGMTVVPNLLVTGILTIIASLAVMFWAPFVRTKRRGYVLILLSVLMLLVGGGFGPPIIGILAGVAGTGAGEASSRRRKRSPAKRRPLLAKFWPWTFGIAVANGLFLVIGSLLLVYLFDVNNPDLFVGSFFFSVVSLFLTILTGRAYDRREREQGPATFE